jgi:hypothetical protein
MARAWGRRGLVVAGLVGGLLAGTGAGAAQVVAGVEVPTEVRVQGAELQLNGAGLVRRLVFEVHVTGLYLEASTRSAGEAVRSDQKKHLEFWFKRGLSHGQLREAIRTGLVQNAGSALGRLEERVDRLMQSLPAVAEGERLSMTYVPGAGTRIAHNGRTLLTVEGKDFADALFSAWLGPEPISSSLKQDLLRGGQ